MRGQGKELGTLLTLHKMSRAGNLTARMTEGTPDVITYSILIKGVAATDNLYAGAKIMQLYREMRGQYGIRPDMALVSVMVHSLGRAR